MGHEHPNETRRFAARQMRSCGFQLGNSLGSVPGRRMSWKWKNQYGEDGGGVDFATLMRLIDDDDDDDDDDKDAI